MGRFEALLGTRTGARWTLGHLRDSMSSRNRERKNLVRRSQLVNYSLLCRLLPLAKAGQRKKKKGQKLKTVSLRAGQELSF